jgi:hypothetical protein
MHILHNPEESATYEQNRTQILTAVEFRLVNQLANKKKIKAASLNNIAYAVSQVNNMIRLEKGQATSITEHIDGDLSGMIDQLCGGMKSAGSGSTVSNSTHSEPVDILDSLLPAPNDTLIHDTLKQASELPILTQAPAADRSIQGNLEASIPAAKLTKSGLPRKPRTSKPSKSATNSRKQASCNITASLDSKDSETKQASEPVPNNGNTSTDQKEWYE